MVKLKNPSEVSSITLNQLGASGGSISVFTNDRPSLDGAKQVGTNSFTSPDLTMPLTEPATAPYVIVTIKSLPKLAAPKTRYGMACVWPKSRSGRGFSAAGELPVPSRPADWGNRKTLTLPKTVTWRGWRCVQALWCLQPPTPEYSAP